jgi:glycyl-tRNA synthetase beta chain
MRNKTVLLEIGAEEIPARFLPKALEDFRRTIILELHIKRNIPVELNNISTMGTPRRLAAIVRGLPEMQEDRKEEVFGPPKQAAFDTEGNPTKAAIGFAKSQGVHVKDLQVKQEVKGEYVCAVVEHRGRSVAEVLPEALREVILGLAFPKSMRWGSGDMRFARPIHWVLALFGSQPVSFELDGIKSGNRSRGHRFLAPREFAVRGVKDYIEKLRERYVMVDPEERMDAVRKQAEECAKSVSSEFRYDYDEELLATVTHLVEYPQAVLGSFDEKYLELPEELLVSVMKGHQKYFSVIDGAAHMKNHFIVIGNTTKENSGTVRRGAERVLRARFEDARFYFEEDRKVSLADRVEGLKKVTFHDGLGTLHDKTLRVKTVAVALAELLCPEKKGLAARAAELSKADLITGVVREFPELQGIMGMYYAWEDGEEEEVAQALREQYLPAFSGDRVPESDVGTVLALADRVDNIVSFFDIGLIPTGSEDPYALRRAAMGLLAIWMSREFKFSDLFQNAPKSSNTALVEKIQQFVVGRIGPILESKGYASDVIDATEFHHVTYEDATKRMKALEAFKSNPKYNDFLIAIKRVRNIVANIVPSAQVDEKLQKEELEKRLHKEFSVLRVKVQDLVEGSQYSEAIEELLRLIEPINAFFDKVLVMDRDEKIKNNRLSLLWNISDLAERVADFSRLQERGESSS